MAPSIPATATTPSQPLLTSVETTGNTTEDINELPAYTLSWTTNFIWGAEDGESLAQSVNAIYDEVVHWKLNLFKTPSGKAGRLFVQEVTRLFTAYAENSALESVSLKAAMIMPTLLLQKPHQRSKPKEFSSHLERRLKLWLEATLKNC